MALLNYTTEIDADKTAGEISRMLSKAGAQAVLTEYDEEEGYVKALSFRIKLNDQLISFRLPSDWRPVQKVLENQRNKNRRVSASREQAVRVAWRILKDWVEAQLALIETQMVTTQQVFLPYAVTKDGSTLYEKIAQNPELLLGDGK